MDSYTLLGALLLINILVVGMTMTMTEWFDLGYVEAISQTDVELFLTALVILANICLVLLLGGRCR